MVIFLSCFLIKIFYTFPTPHALHMVRSSHPSSSNQPQLWNYLHPLLTVIFLRPNNHFSTLFSDTTNTFFSFRPATAQLRPRPPLCLVSRTHTIRHTHSHPVGLLRTCDKLVAETATYTTRNTHKRRTTMSSARFETAIPAIGRPQTHAYKTARLAGSANNTH